MITPRTPAQVKYLQTLNKTSRPIKLVTGPAGTGKTLFACQVAAEKLASNSINKIVLTRPIVAVDEDMGYLPGSMDEKMQPWTRPMFEILSDYFPNGRLAKLVNSKRIEVAPLGFMRGRTLEDCWVIADEMQNSTPNQMKMLLTRTGEGTQMIITGDVDQCDLPNPGGLEDILKRIGTQYDMRYIEHIVLGDDDVQRHPAVREVLKLY